jgi:Glycosyl hydrolase family 26
MPVASIYEDTNFQGASAQLDVGQYDWGQLGIGNDSLCSLRVAGGYTISLYENTHFQGRRKVYSGGCDLNIGYIGDDFNDITSSITVTRRTVDTPHKVLNYLYSIAGCRTVSGEHNREPLSDPARWTNAIYDTTGKFPGLWSSDFLFEPENIANRQTMIDEAKRQWSQGTIVHLMYHACPPTQHEACAFNGGVQSSLSPDEWDQLITAGTTLNSVWLSRLDTIATFLQDLKNNGVEVLWRPLHEMNQGAFWWGGRPGPNGTSRLYQITHDYLVGRKGLTNLIWVWDMQDFATLQQTAGQLGHPLLRPI